MQNQAYIYPITNRNKKGITNPYLDNFMLSLESKIKFTNKTSPSDIGILNLFKYIFKRLDYVFLNWIEDLPDKKIGIIQCYLLVYFIFPFLHIKKTKIIWTLHNKLTHYNTNLKRKSWLVIQLIKHSDIILTHASEGIDFIGNLSPKAAQKVIFIHHPVQTLRLPENKPVKKIDLLIWGTIQKYKGIPEFFKAYEKVPELLKYKVIIAGKVPDKEYYTKIESSLPENVELRNDYIPFDTLYQMMYESKAILFTYKNDSILSSGALMDSLITGTRVIGPETGAFNDLKKLGLVDTYKKVSDIEKILENTSDWPNINKLKSFYKENNWETFGKQLIKVIEK